MQERFINRFTKCKPFTLGWYIDIMKVVTDQKIRCRDMAWEYEEKKEWLKSKSALSECQYWCDVYDFLRQRVVNKFEPTPLRGIQMEEG